MQILICKIDMREEPCTRCVSITTVLYLQPKYIRVKAHTSPSATFEKLISKFGIELYRTASVSQTDDI